MCVCVYEAVRLTGYTICLVVRMHFCGSECASKTTPPVDRTRLVMAARMIAFDFPCTCLVFSSDFSNISVGKHRLRVFHVFPCSAVFVPYDFRTTGS